MSSVLSSRAALAGGALVSLAVLVAVVGGCAGRGAPAGPATPSDGGVVSSGPMPSAPTASGPAASDPSSAAAEDEVVPERASDLVRVPWTRVEAVPGRSELVVHATLTGAPPCTVVGRVDTAESDRSVTVTLWVGHRAGAACDGPQPQLAHPVRVRVSLDAPVGYRTTLDGAR